MFADDTAIYYSASNNKEIEDVLNADLANPSLWIQSNGLALNIKKTEYMVVGSHLSLKLLQTIDLRLNISIVKVRHISTLVLYLTWIFYGPHTQTTFARKLPEIGLMKRTRPFLSRSTAKLVYLANIEPVFAYCGVVWDECGVIPKNKLQRFQNWAARVILETDTNTFLVVIDKLGMSPLHQKRQCHKAIMM